MTREELKIYFPYSKKNFATQGQSFENLHSWFLYRYEEQNTVLFFTKPILYPLFSHIEKATFHKWLLFFGGSDDKLTKQ